MSQDTYCTEAPELVELCGRCIKPDCVSYGGCKDYKALKKQIAQRDKKATQSAPVEEKPVNMPAMELEIVPVNLAGNAAETLQKCNAAIEALEAMQNDDGCNMIFDSVMIDKLLQSLKETRIREYAALIDWDAIAEKMKQKGGCGNETQ